MTSRGKQDAAYVALLSAYLLLSSLKLTLCTAGQDEPFVSIPHSTVLRPTDKYARLNVQLKPSALSCLKIITLLPALSVIYDMIKHPNQSPVNTSHLFGDEAETGTCHMTDT